MSDVVPLMDVQQSAQGLQQLVAKILDEARTQGADQAEVAVNEDVGLSVTVRDSELETVEFNSDRGFGITVYVEGKRGSASTSDSRPSAIAETVAAALQIARFTQHDPCSGLADAELMPKVLPELDLYHPWDLDAAQAEDLAKECEQAGLAMDSRIKKSDGASVGTHRSCRVYGNSHGFIGSYAGTRHGLNVTYIADEGTGMQRDYWYTSARYLDALESAQAVGQRAAERTLARLSPRKVTTGQFPVIFSPQMAIGLLGHLMGAISGGALYKKSSFLLDSLGTQVLNSQINVAEEPLLRRQVGSASFDGDGVATREKHFVRDGVIENYVLSTYTARQLGMATTGNAGGVHNLTLSGAERPAADLIADVSQGLYVTELMGQGVNPVTGDYSRGAGGFWIDNGELTYPVDEITIAGNLKDMFKDITSLGDDLDVRGNYRAPSVLIGKMTLAGE